LIVPTAILRGRVTVPITCSVIACMLSFSAATAAYGVPVATGTVALYQDEAQGASTVDSGVQPSAVDAPIADSPAADQAGESAPTEEWVEPAAIDAATDTASKETLADSPGTVDPSQDAWTDPEPASSAPEVDPTSGEEVDPATGKGVEPAPADAAPVAPAPSEASAPPNIVGSGGTEPLGEPIATAYITNTGGDGAPCLAAPQWGAETLAVFDEGMSVEVRAQTQGEWQPVNCAGVGGYVHVALIAWTPVGASDSVTAGEQPGGKTGGVAAGEQIVDFALQFEGYPYVYAGEGPYAFDCSGFTMYVIHNTLGIDIPHDMAVQYQMGRTVSRDKLQPGDLVFFANTLRRGCLTTASTSAVGSSSTPRPNRAE
jgi:cell wall-associated NlpC family hydrolase